MIEVLFPGDDEHFSSRPERPLSEAELKFRLHCRADDPRARSVTPHYSAWAAKARERWALEHDRPAHEPKKKKPAPRHAGSAPVYDEKWSLYH